MRVVLLVASVSATLMLSPAAADAATRCWAAGAPSTGGQWNTPSNWSAGVVPGPGDVAALDGMDGDPGCSAPADVVLSGVSAEVDLVRQASTVLIVEGTGVGLTLRGVTGAGERLGNMQVRNGATLTIAAGADVHASGTIALGSPSGGGSVFIDGTLRAVTGSGDALNISDEPAGGGSVNVTSGGSLVFNAGTTGSVKAAFENDGTVSLLGSTALVHASAGSPTSDGTFSISTTSTLGLRPTRLSTMTVAGAIIGPGHLDVSASEGPPFGVGTVSMPGDATLSVLRLSIGTPSALSIGSAGAAAGQLTMTGGLRLGDGTLTTGTAIIGGGTLTGGTTKVTGSSTITGGTFEPAISGGAKLRTEGATTWSGGKVILGAPAESGTWENAGALTINNASVAGEPLQLDDGSDSGLGVLRNLAGATIERGAPAGTMFGDGRIENAGSVYVTAGTLGQPDGGPTGAFVQSAGLTTVAAGSRLSMNVTLGGGRLRGSGSVRRLVNSAGTVEPGDSPGTLTVTEDYTQGAGGTLQHEINGPGDVQADQLLVGGLATLGGTLAIATAAGYTPDVQSTYRPVHSATRAGQFASVTGSQLGADSYLTDYLVDGVRLCFAACPGEGLPAYDLNVALAGDGSGTVTSDIAGIECAPDCAARYVSHTVLKLSASPSGESTFAGWSGDCAGGGDCVVTMDRARSVTATFAAPAPPPAPPPESPPESPPPPAPAPAPPPPAPAPAAQVAQPPAPVPAPKPRPANKKATIKASRLVTFPSARRCIRRTSAGRRSFRLRLKIPKSVRVSRAHVTIAGKRVSLIVGGRRLKVLRGNRLKSTIRLRSIPKKRFRLAVSLRLADGRTLSTSRRYRVCRSSRKR